MAAKLTPHTGGSENSGIGLFVVDSDVGEVVVGESCINREKSAMIMLALNKKSLVKAFKEQAKGQIDSPELTALLAINIATSIATDKVEVADSTEVKAFLFNLEIQNADGDLIIDASSLIPLNVIHSWLRYVVDNNVEVFEITVTTPNNFADESSVMSTALREKAKSLDRSGARMNQSLFGFAYTPGKDTLDKMKERLEQMESLEFNDEIFGNRRYPDKPMYIIGSVEDRKGGGSTFGTSQA